MKEQTAIVKSFAKMDPEVLATAEMLSSKYAPLLDATHLADIMGVKTNTIIDSISRERFPIEITKLGKSWYATAYSVAEYVVNNKQNKNAAA